MSRRKAREKALQALYQAEISENNINTVFGTQASGIQLSSESQDFYENIARKTWENRDTLDAYIKKYAQRWDIKRLAVIDRNIMRLCIYEMIFEPDIPYHVSIDEAIELAKKFSTEKASGFVNGILDNVKREIENG